MSVKIDHRITCPRCGHKQLSELWSVVTTKDIHAAQQVRDERLNRFDCARCDHRGSVDVSLLYHDLESGYCIQYLCKLDADRADTYRNINKQGGYVIPHGSLAKLERMGETCLAFPHFVFSMREMVAYIRFRDRCAQWGV